MTYFFKSLYNNFAIEFKCNLNNNLNNISFFVILFSISILIWNKTDQLTLLNIFILTIIFCSAASGENAFKFDIKEGMLMQLFMNNINIESYILAKITTCFIFNSLPSILFASFVFFLMDLPYNFILDFFIIMFFIGINLTSIFCFLSCATGKNSYLSLIIGLPIILPIILIAISPFYGNLLNIEFSDILKFITALSFFLNIIFIYSCKIALKINME